MYSDKYDNESNEIYSYKTYNIFAYIIGILLSPLLGVIMGIVGVTQRKKYAWSIIIISILGYILNFFLLNRLL
ncbi:hypothetical protein AEA09_05835 [Lysinibacillus contaminans]|uniref:Uncharacterized protein n=1 Tax=Lysinibacillus contaminans TaxID=1293441 RepID=A0ABR5JZN0_9BACI|nr:hypothetical protein [Lysinibacillus contaminans]KOS68120.1 hypothetical protein AEA09_05835 [Lysinibacillus contaminans]